jgi:hypothetical protein
MACLTRSTDPSALLRDVVREYLLASTDAGGDGDVATVEQPTLEL